MRAEPQLTQEQHEALKKASYAVAAALHETQRYPLYVIKRLIRARGEAFVWSFAERAQEREAAGGMWCGSRRRTLGGIFFRLVKDALGEEGYRAAVPLTTSEFLKRERDRYLQRLARADALQEP